LGLVSFLNRLTSRRRPDEPSTPDDAVSYRPIGVVRNDVRESRPDGWEHVRSEIVLRDDLEPALEAIEGFSHVIVVFHLDRVPARARRLRLPVGNESPPPQRGVLATRSQLRPNPIGVAVVPLLEHRGAVLRVEGLDAIDGTPVLDVKPYLPAFDAVPRARLPAWARFPEPDADASGEPEA
jgi:tRNA-Thr(GGU) m(6)t(6)A37 methyltransferase TsaA